MINLETDKYRLPLMLLNAGRDPPFFRLVYTAFMDRHKARATPWLLASGFLFSTYLVAVPAGPIASAFAIALAGFIIYLVIAIIYAFLPKYRIVLPSAVWFAVWVQLIIAAMDRQGDTFNEILGWALYLQFLSLCTIPRSREQLMAYSLLSTMGYVGAQYRNAWAMTERLPANFVFQILSDSAMFFAASFIGISAYLIWNKDLKAFYSQIRYTLFVKKAMEKRAVEQERLVLSVLPEHVAVQMRDNLGLIDTQFKKIYMSRHENVSILYADIVGFTAISSTYSAQDLVAILNELFARFDRLAEKYEQLRIKILGDCYYCISGAPVERKDHAVLCVHMGLSMVKAIKYVQQTTNSPVDMRVGIHTGAVLAGVLGQRQWQFDVYSRDVELANKMESSGMAGRVHISEVTLSYLNDEFEVEPAYGERREPMLRQAGIKTYFITKVLKPLDDVSDTDGADDADTEAGDNKEEERANVQLITERTEDSGTTPQPAPRQPRAVRLKKKLDFTEEELIALDHADDLEKMTPWMTFKDPELERRFYKQYDMCPISATRLPLFLLPTFGFLSTFIKPVPWTHFIFLFSCVFSLVYTWHWRYYSNVKMNNPVYWRMLVLYISIAFLVVDNFATLVMCGVVETTYHNNYNATTMTAPGVSSRCYHSSFYYHLAAIALCGTFWIRGPILMRAAILSTITAVNIIPAFLAPVPITELDFYPFTVDDWKTGVMFFTSDFGSVFEPIVPFLVWMHEYRNILMVIFIAIALFLFYVFLELEERTRFCRGRGLQNENLRYQEMSKRNQAMVNNVLPPHVAKHFMGGQHKHRDLYSQSYSEVGVLFASMPNFTEFYSEESVNNQGLECLRFLNEVISDFDMLLDDPRFSKYIFKIKTISSTYMAASGLGPKDKLKTSNAVSVRWAHLSWLVVFALELQRTLAAINEQSFNHFVLRLGINHGPITAGVIGARKPHYDIWGNTVNVASRMESTGKAGCIQVTEETSKILEEFGYRFEQRGLVAVKGKGELMTYYLIDKDLPPPLPVEPIDPENHHPWPVEDANDDSLSSIPGARPSSPSDSVIDFNLGLPEQENLQKDKKEKKNTIVRLRE